MRNAQNDLELCYKATPGPWMTDPDDENGVVFTNNKMLLGANNYQNYENDMKFIAESREALPYWIKRVVEAEELLNGIFDDIVCGNMACRGGEWYRKIKEFLGGGEG